MFRSIKGKKKTPRSIRRTTVEEEDETQQSTVATNERDDGNEHDDEAPNLVLLLQKQRQDKRKKKTSKRKGDDTDTEKTSSNRTTVVANGSGKKSSRKRSRIAYGGSIVMEEEEQQQHFEHAAGEKPAESLYDSAALAQLKAEQATRNIDDVKEKEAPQHKNNHESRGGPHGTEESKGESNEAADFLSFDNNHQSNGHQILAGDEAFEMDLDQDTWQQQVAKRAGIANSNAKSDADSSKSTAAIKTLSLDQVRSQFANVQSSLKEQIEVVGTSFRRRENDIKQTEQEELKNHTNTVDSYGRALEFYQSWRARAVPHVAALRDLAWKLNELQSALVDNFALPPNLARTRRKLYIEDSLAALHESNRLDKVLGKQLNPEVFSSAASGSSLDEFGRSVKSQYVLQREKRAQQHQQLQSERKERKEESETHALDSFDWMLDSEIESWRKQRFALKEALTFAIAQVRHEYTEMSELVDLFSDWKDYDTQEYKDCFAPLSLVDISSVLVRLNFFSSLTERNELDTSQYENLFKLGIEGEALIRLQEKSIDHFLIDLMKSKAYDVESVAGTLAMIQFWKLREILRSAGTNSGSKPWAEDVDRPLLALLKSSLEEISLSVLSPYDQSVNDADVPFRERAVIKEQLAHVERVVQHIFKWRKILPVDEFDASLGELLLNFVQDTYLPFLSSFLGAHSVFRDGKQGRSAASKSFAVIWGLLETTDWIKRPEYLIQSTTIQAASEVYTSHGT